jgi:hypothetical protein
MKKWQINMQFFYDAGLDAPMAVFLTQGKQGATTCQLLDTSRAG